MLLYRIDPKKNRDFDTVPSNPLAKYLKAHWPLNEGAGTRVHDVGGRYFTGNFAGTPVWVNDGIRHGHVLQFNGTTSQINFGNVCDFASQSFSVAAWVNYGASFGSNYPSFVSKNTGAVSPANTGWDLSIRTDAGFVGFPYMEIVDGTNKAVATWSGAITDSKWHLLVGTVDRAAQLVGISVDGQAAATASTSAVGSISTASSLYFGSRQDTSFNYYAGLLDDVQVWDGRPLTMGEIQMLYTQRKAIRSMVAMAAAAGSALRVTGSFAEVLVQNTPYLQVGQMAAEALGQHSTALQVAGTRVEVLRTTLQFVTTRHARPQRTNSYIIR